MTKPEQSQLYIDGKFVPAKSGKTYPNIAPATGQVIGTAADGGGEDMDAAIAAARRAFDGSDWSTDRALRLKTKLIGINNRNLRIMQTDLNTTIELAPRVPADRVIVGESGLKTNADLHAMAVVGARRFLVGESLLRQPDLVAATRALLG